LRRHGSGNLGATNVYRVLGGYAIPVTLFDVIKGALPVAYQVWSQGQPGLPLA
jgi:glycerol-3-phosphate acyltransferase PlsY